MSRFSTLPRAYRLDTWIAQEIADYETHHEPLGDQEREHFETHLRGTLQGQQLALADSAGDLGDTILAALKDHSDRLRDTAVLRWLRDPR